MLSENCQLSYQKDVFAVFGSLIRISSYIPPPPTHTHTHKNSYSMFNKIDIFKALLGLLVKSFQLKKKKKKNDTIVGQFLEYLNDRETSKLLKVI